MFVLAFGQILQIIKIFVCRLKYLFYICISKQTNHRAKVIIFLKIKNHDKAGI